MMSKNKLKLYNCFFMPDNNLAVKRCVLAYSYKEIQIELYETTYTAFDNNYTLSYSGNPLISNEVKDQYKSLFEHTRIYENNKHRVNTFKMKFDEVAHIHNQYIKRFSPIYSPKYNALFVELLEQIMINWDE